MNNFEKKDGSKIVIAFSDVLRPPYENQESFFSVTVPEYKYVPNGPVELIKKTVSGTHCYYKYSFDFLDEDIVSSENCSITDGVLKENMEKTIIEITPENLTDYFSVTDGSPYTFSYDETVNGYKSNNGGVNSSTATKNLTPLLDTEIKFHYTVSSESRYDKFAIRTTSKTYVNYISGVAEGDTDPIYITRGETLIFTYSKDGSGHVGSDCAIFSFKDTKICKSKENFEIVLKKENITLENFYNIITWEEEKDENAELYLYVKIGESGTYSKIQNGKSFLRKNQKLINETVYLKIVGHGNIYFVKNIKVSAIDVEDANKLVLDLEPIHPVNRFPGAIGDITVSYSGGDLNNYGGKVEDFTISFAPEDLEWKGHVIEPDMHSIDVNVDPTIIDLIKITYHDRKSNDENIDVNVVIESLDLINIKDL